MDSFPERLRNARFRQDQPKPVDYSVLWEERGGIVPEDSEAEKDLLAIIYAIDRGNLVPERCYRRGVDRNHPEDRLLRDQGIHLGGADSD